MTVREKIAQKKTMLAAKNMIEPTAQLYTCRCMVCKENYKTAKELDLDGKGRCPPCQKIREAEIKQIVSTLPPMQKEPPRPSFDNMPGIIYNGIKFVPLK